MFDFNLKFGRASGRGLRKKIDRPSKGTARRRKPRWSPVRSKANAGRVAERQESLQNALSLRRTHAPQGEMQRAKWHT